jgi:hypothetical protein
LDMSSVRTNGWGVNMSSVHLDTLGIIHDFQLIADIHNYLLVLTQVHFYIDFRK